MDTGEFSATKHLIDKSVGALRAKTITKVKFKIILKILGSRYWFQLKTLRLIHILRPKYFDFFSLFPDFVLLDRFQK